MWFTVVHRFLFQQSGDVEFFGIIRAEKRDVTMNEKEFNQLVSEKGCNQFEAWWKGDKRFVNSGLERRPHNQTHQAWVDPAVRKAQDRGILRAARKQQRLLLSLQLPFQKTRSKKQECPWHIILDSSSWTSCTDKRSQWRQYWRHSGQRADSRAKERSCLYSSGIFPSMQQKQICAHCSPPTTV